jgi:hypothetical protein
MADDDQQPEKNLMDPTPFIIAGVMAVPVIVVLGWFAFG